MALVFLRSTLLTILALFCLTSCQQESLVVSSVSEREANEIIVFLASKGIRANKTAAGNTSPGASQGPSKWDISVDDTRTTEAMAILNQNGLPRIKGTNLLDLFAKQGMMSSDKEDTIRFQAGLAEQIAGTIRKIDGIIDADLQISFPSSENASNMPWEKNTQQKITAAVYIKHQGVLDDPNSHLVMKIKRLVSGSVQELDVNDVTIISDRARFSDIQLSPITEALSSSAKEKEYVNIWSIVMSKSSASRFRTLFLALSFLAMLFALLTSWFLWKLYPVLKSKGGFKKLFLPNPFPLEQSITPSESTLAEEEKPKT